MSNNLEKRINDLEKRTGGQGTTPETHLDTDGFIEKLGLDPEKVKAKAKENEQSIACAIAGELGMSYQDFKEALKRRARGE